MRRSLAEGQYNRRPLPLTQRASRFTAAATCWLFPAYRLYGYCLFNHSQPLQLQALATTQAHLGACQRPMEIRMFATLTKLLKNEDGATAIEYGLIAALIAVAAVTVLGTVGTNLTATFSTVATKL
jgi:pilus assembly protein Flp/PilA